MVINCVPTAERRGEMLVGYRKHLRPGGHLFLMLPLLCLTKSTRTTRASFVETLHNAGFRIRETRDSPKVAFFCATAVEEVRRDTKAQANGAGIANRGARSDGMEGSGASKEKAKRTHRGCNEFAVAI